MTDSEELPGWNDLDVDTWLEPGSADPQVTRNMRAASGLHQHGHLTAEEKTKAKHLAARDPKFAEHMATMRKDVPEAQRKNSWLNIKSALRDEGMLQVDNLGLSGMDLLESESNLLLGGSFGDFDMAMDAFDFNDAFQGQSGTRRLSVQKQHPPLMSHGLSHQQMQMQHQRGVPHAQTPQQMHQMHQLQQQQQQHHMHAGMPVRPTLSRPPHGRGGAAAAHNNYGAPGPYAQQQPPPRRGPGHPGPAGSSKWSQQPPPPPPPPMLPGSSSSSSAQGRFDVGPRGGRGGGFAGQQQQQQQQRQHVPVAGLGLLAPAESPMRSPSGASEDMLNDESFTPKEKKNERERRRRLQVSHGFTELFKVLKLSDAAKMEKSTVLNASIDKLKELANAHAMLLEENSRLRMQASKAGIKV